VYLTGGAGRTAFAGTDERFDPRPWVAGETYPVTSTFRLPGDLLAGRYTVRIALVDESGEPRVRLGIAGADAQLRYPLGTVQIAAAR
jgi:hypothetical protein